MKINKQLGTKPDIALNLWWISIIYSKMKYKSQAIKSMKHAISIYNELGLENMVKQVQKSIDGLKD